MEPRMKLAKVIPDAYRAMAALERWVANAGVEKRLHNLVKIRASQINGCAFCIDLHTREARELGEEERRIYALDAWRESPLFSEEERAALTEAVTLVSETRVSDETWERAEGIFSEEGMTRLLMAIVAIND